MTGMAEWMTRGMGLIALPGGRPEGIILRKKGGPCE